MLESQGVAHRKRVLAFIDEALAPCYRGWRIKTDAPDYERLAELASLLPQAEKAMHAAVEQLVSVASVNAGRGEVQRALNANKALLTPLIPTPLLKARVGEILEATGALAMTAGSGFLAAHAQAAELLSHFRREMEDAGPVAVRVLSPLVGRLQKLCADAYGASPATEPADLSAAAVPKKYLFQPQDVELRLAVAVTNHGPGQALDARLDEMEAEGVTLISRTVPLGQLMRGTIGTTISARAVPEPSDAALLSGRVRWRDSDGTERSTPFEVIFEAQRTDIPWESLKQRYDLDPVRSTDELLGRGEVLRDLQDLIGERRVGSAFITGQKRVGKTSIALTFQGLLSDDPDVAVVYFEAGVFVQPSAARTVVTMGQAISDELLGVDPRFADIPAPEFEQTLAPLRGIVGQMRARAEAPSSDRA